MALISRRQHYEYILAADDEAALRFSAALFSPASAADATLEATLRAPPAMAISIVFFSSSDGSGFAPAYITMVYRQPGHRHGDGAIRL